MLGFDFLQEAVDEINSEYLYSEQARFQWLVQKIDEMRLTHSKLVSEAESRVSVGNLSWSEMIFTDIFGPDLQILGEISARITSLEQNIKKYYDEALSLYAVLSRSC